ELQEDFQGACPPFQQRGQLVGACGVGEKAFEIVQCHVRVRTARQQTAERMTQLFQRIQTNGVSQEFEIMPAVLVVAQAPALQDGSRLIDRFDAVAELIEVHELKGSGSSRQQATEDSLASPEAAGQRMRQYL